MLCQWCTWLGSTWLGCTWHVLLDDLHDVSPCCIYGRCEEVGEEMGADEFNCQLEPRPPVRRPCYSPCVGECVVSEWTEWSRCKQVGNSTLSEFLCPSHSKNGGEALSVTPVRASVRPLSKFGVRLITFERLHRFNSNLVCWYIISKYRSIWVTIH